MILFTFACSIKTHVLCRFCSSSSPCNLPVNLIKLINIQHSWSICLSQDGEYLAVLQDNMLEIRSRRDRYMLCWLKYLFQRMIFLVAALSILYILVLQASREAVVGMNISQIDKTIYMSSSLRVSLALFYRQAYHDGGLIYYATQKCHSVLAIIKNLKEQEKK